jgi:hypothetical protein
MRFRRRFYPSPQSMLTFTNTSTTPALIPFEAFVQTITAECLDGSHIHPSLIPLCLQFIEETKGQWEVHELLGLPIRRFTEGNLLTGQWNRPHVFGGGAFFTSENGEIFNAKALNPRIDYRSEGKTIRYEAVVGSSNRLFYPPLSDEVRAIISLQQQVKLPTVAEAPEVWSWILAHPEISVGVTEGAKKALSLCSSGFLCVAVYGITNWSVPHSFPRLLLPDLETLAEGDRLIPVWYDQDDQQKNPKAFYNGKQQGWKLVSALRSAGASKKSALMYWSSSMGKGIDDAIVHLADQGMTIDDWIDARILDSEQASRYAYAKNLRDIAPDRPIFRETMGGFVPPMPLHHGYIHALISGTGSGKTTIVRALVKDWVSNGGFAVVITPTNKLGEQNALPHAQGGFDLPHRHNHHHLDLLMMEAEAKGGIITCLDSLPTLLPYIGMDRPLMVFLDEGDQTANHLTEGQTLKGKLSNTARALENLLTRAEAVIIAEAQLPEETLRLYEALSGKKTKVFLHHQHQQGRSVKVFRGNVSGFEKKIIDHLIEGEKLLITVDSQREGEKLERLIEQTLVNKTGLRVDRLTAYHTEIKSLTRDPNTYLASHPLDYLILSPAIKSGWDLTGAGYQFDRVCGLFRVLPLSDQIQMPARYRPDCTWDLWVANTIQTTPDERRSSVKALIAEASLNTKQTADFFGFPYNPDNRPTLETVLRHHRAVAATRAGLEKSIAHFALVQRLQEDGHTVTEADCTAHPETKTAMQAIGVEIEKEWAMLIAETLVGVGDDLNEARRLSSLECPRPTDRAKAEKIRLLHRFPTVNFDLVEVCYHATAHYHALTKGIELQARAENLPATISQQREATAVIYSEEIVVSHHLPTSLQQAILVQQVEILPMLKGQWYQATSPDLEALKQRCLLHSEAFKKYLGLNFTDTQTPASFFNRLAKKLGFEKIRTRQGSLDREYCYSVHTVHSIAQSVMTAQQELDILKEYLEVVVDITNPADPIRREIHAEIESAEQQLTIFSSIQERVSVRASLLLSAQSRLSSIVSKDQGLMESVAVVTKHPFIPKEQIEYPALLEATG